jgi:hypothetical protein
MKYLQNHIVYLIALTLAPIIGVDDPQIASAAEARLVRVWSVGDGELTGFRIDPTALHIEKNTIVLWMSGVRDEEIQIVFESGKQCRDVTANPNEKNPAFSLDASNCYVTTIMGFGDTSALEFVDVGRFEYTVQSREGKVKAVGKICVRDSGDEQP